LSPNDKALIDASSGGYLLVKTPEEARELIENIADASQHFRTRATASSSKGVFGVTPNESPDLAKAMGDIASVLKDIRDEDEEEEFLKMLEEISMKDDVGFEESEGIIELGDGKQEDMPRVTNLSIPPSNDLVISLPSMEDTFDSIPEKLSDPGPSKPEKFIEGKASQDGVLNATTTLSTHSKENASVSSEGLSHHPPPSKHQPSSITIVLLRRATTIVLLHPTLFHHHRRQTTSKAPPPTNHHHHQPSDTPSSITTIFILLRNRRTTFNHHSPPKPLPLFGQTRSFIIHHFHGRFFSLSLRSRTADLHPNRSPPNHHHHQPPPNPPPSKHLRSFIIFHQTAVLRNRATIGASSSSLTHQAAPFLKLLLLLTELTAEALQPLPPSSPSTFGHPPLNKQHLEALSSSLTHHHRTTITTEPPFHVFQVMTPSSVSFLWHELQKQGK
ncbi:hypothetical protein PIB30_104302, partial [Stylosanthes scabra]|nr:hypothetical protein [Stylosanthes scabra]